MLMSALLPFLSATRARSAAIVQALTTVLASRGTLVTGKIAQVRLLIVPRKSISLLNDCFCLFVDASLFIYISVLSLLL